MRFRQASPIPIDYLAPCFAALISIIVNYGGTFTLVFQAAHVAHLTSNQIASWVWSIAIGVGITGAWLSYKYREPIITAWSTPGVAFLISVLPFTSYNEIIGAYILSAIGFLILGVTGSFEKIVSYIPSGIASGLLAGILLRFGVNAFGGVNLDPTLVVELILIYAFLKRYSQRFALPTTLIIGIIICAVDGRFDISNLTLSFAKPIFVTPEFSTNSFLNVALPLFLITLTGQYMPGMLVLRNDHYKTSANPILTITGIGSLLMAPFGSHPFNIAAITAAICTGKDAHPDPSRRYIAGIACGGFHIVIGIFGVTLATLFTILPATLITTIAGLALIGAIGSSLSSAISDVQSRETSLITFLATAADITLLGISGAFWGLIIGLTMHMIIHSYRTK